MLCANNDAGCVMIMKAPDYSGPLCPFNNLKTVGSSLCNKTLTGPMNCALLSDCPIRNHCLKRVMQLVDALETGDKGEIQRIIER